MPDIYERVEKSLGKEFTDLLRKSQQTSSPGYGIPYEGATIIEAIGRFAILLSTLYLAAEEQTNRVINLTRDLICLTKVLIGITAILVVLATYSAVEPYFHHQTNNQTTDNKSEPGQSYQFQQLTVPY